MVVVAKRRQGIFGDCYTSGIDVNNVKGRLTIWKMMGKSLSRAERLRWIESAALAWQSVT